MPARRNGLFRIANSSSLKAVDPEAFGLNLNCSIFRRHACPSAIVGIALRGTIK
jgi:hypothetical protein